MPYLVIGSEKNLPRVFELKSKIATIGRSEDNDIIVNDPLVSRRHFQVFMNSRQTKILDMGGTNGTKVNGVRIREGYLTDGDEIKIGKTTLFFRTNYPNSTAEKPEEEMDDPILGRILLHHPLKEFQKIDDLKNVDSLLPEDSEVKKMTVAEGRVFRCGLADVLHAVSYLYDGKKRPNDLIQNLLTLVVKLIPCHTGLIFLKEPIEGDQLKFTVGSPVEADFFWPTVQNIISKVLAEHEGYIIIKSTFEESATEELWLMAAPIWHQNTVMGTIILADIIPDRSFSRQDLQLLFSLSHLLGAMTNK